MGSADFDNPRRFESKIPLRIFWYRSSVGLGGLMERSMDRAEMEPLYRDANSENAMC